jgi:hypothetical protein
MSWAISVWRGHLWIKKGYRVRGLSCVNCGAMLSSKLSAIRHVKLCHYSFECDSPENCANKIIHCLKINKN